MQGSKTPFELLASEDPFLRTLKGVSLHKFRPNFKQHFLHILILSIVILYIYI